MNLAIIFDTTAIRMVKKAINFTFDWVSLSKAIAAGIYLFLLI